MPSQAEKGRVFGELHARPGLFLLPNPWDAGTAKLLQSLGFEALATTSLGMSNALGRVDGDNAVSREELLENCRLIASATDLPVNADLENGYADDPRQAATIRRLCEEDVEPQQGPIPDRTAICAEGDPVVLGAFRDQLSGRFEFRG